MSLVGNIQVLVSQKHHEVSLVLKMKGQIKNLTDTRALHYKGETDFETELRDLSSVTPEESGLTTPWPLLLRLQTAWHPWLGVLFRSAGESVEYWRP